jgi:hypothetical protein
VQDVADDHHPLALDIAEALPDGECVEQCLGGVLVGAVPAPDAGCRIISMSAPAARSVSAVSRSDSPLAAEEPEELTLITSALIHLPATSKDTRVRVEFS